MAVAISQSIAHKTLLLSWLVVFCNASNINGEDEARVGWVVDGGQRSSFDILWSCLSVILVCTYKVLHLNLPAYKEAEASWHESSFWKKWFRKLKWMGFMALSPELLLSMAMQDWLWKRDSVRKFAKAGAKQRSLPRLSKSPADTIKVEDGEVTSTARVLPNHLPLRDWTGVHAHYANMGGFIIRFPENDISESQLDSRTGKPISNAARQDASRTHHESFPLFAEQVLVLVEEFSFEIPYVTLGDLKDRSKSDVFTKLFAIGQSSWLIVQCIARAAQGLPITELELATMGFVGCALVMYMFWWHKPFDIEHSLPIYCPPEDRERVIQRLRQMFEARYVSKFLAPNWDGILRTQRIPNWAYMDEGSLGLGHKTWLISMLSIMGMGMAFSAVHLSAWNWAFPSIVEKYLWRYASLAATAACIPTAILLPLLGTGKDPWQRYVVLWVNYPLCGLYLLCRTILMVQVFICFRSMPKGVYESVNWTYFLPQLS